jgi:hypothetical protein
LLTSELFAFKICSKNLIVANCILPLKGYLFNSARQAALVALQWTLNVSLINVMCRCSNGSLSLKQWSTPQISQPCKIMGTTKVSKGVSRRLHGLFKPTVFFYFKLSFSTLFH